MDSVLQWRSANRLATAGTGGWIIALASRFNQRCAQVSVCNFWLEHLVHCASGGSGEKSPVLRKEENGDFRLDKTQAMAYPRNWIEGYRKACLLRYWYSPKARRMDKSLLHAENDVMLDDDDTYRRPDKVLQAYEGNMMVSGEGEDIRYQRLGVS